MSENLALALKSGATLPAPWYTDRAVLERELELVFRRSWQYAGAAAEVAGTGEFLTVRAGRVPIVVVRGRDGSLRGFVNVCRHRGSELVLEERGCRKTLQCHYHAWTYDLDGSLRAAPGSADEADFDRADFSLLPVAVAEWGPWVFVNPDADAAPLEDTLGELPQILADAGLDLGVLRPRETARYEIAANWKVVVDNYLECYHCPTAHPAFAGMFDLASYTVAEYEGFSVQGGPVKESARNGSTPYRLRGGGVEEGIYALLFPNFTINVYPGPGNVSLNVFEPVDERRSVARYQYFFSDEVPEEEVREFVAFVNQIQLEDTVLCESVQRGLESGFFDQGRLLLSRESALRHFQQQVLAAVGI
jgi:phenylpropionate dioxygenase-like ring-hydroxylating dioxygenase large terminal subunit